MLQQVVFNVSLVQKELCARPEDLQHTVFVLMEHMQMYKAWVIVNSVTQASSVQVLEWKHQKNVQMEHTATQLVLDTVFCVQKVIGEVLYPVNQHLLFHQCTSNGCQIITHYDTKFLIKTNSN